MAIFGGRRRAADLEVELARAYAMLAELGALDHIERAARRQAAEQQLAQVLAEEHTARRRIADVERELARLRSLVLQTREEELLQSVGVYDYTHPLESSVAYGERLQRLRTDIRAEVTARRAVSGSRDWHVDGSRRQGAKMIKDFSTLLLRAYNAEADNCVRTVKPHTLASTCQRLDKAQRAIAKLGATMGIAIAPGYHRLRIAEIELTADHIAMVEAERERVRAAKEAAREEERARREFERARAELLEEQAHHRTAYDRLLARSSPDPAAVGEIRARLDRLGADIAAVGARAANTRAGHVYVISNIGSFGEHVVKIGMTRRLDPMDRVRELGAAGVPFRFDVHALVFSDDAVGLEGRLHADLADRRLNKVDQHREFFRTTPAEVRRLLARAAGSHLLEYTETVEALEWRASGATGTAAPRPPAPAPPPAGPDGSPAARPAADEDGPALAGDERVTLTAAHLRLTLHTDDDTEADPIAFLLTHVGEVRTDGDMVFYGQPDHASGAVALAADETGAATALHLSPRAVPADVTEVLLVAQLPADHPRPGTAQLTDLDTGRPLGRLDLPGTGPSGLVQLGVLQRGDGRWHLQVATSALDHDLGALAAAAGVSVD